MILLILIIGGMTLMTTGRFMRISMVTGQVMITRRLLKSAGFYLQGKFLKKIFDRKSGSAEGLALVVDDEPSIRELLEMHLKTVGYDVIKADAVAAAEEILEKGQKVDLIVTDIRMPGDDGLTFAENLRKNQATKKIPILFVSGAFPIRELEKLRERIPNSAAVGKPFTAKKLREGIAKLKPTAQVQRNRTRALREKKKK